MYILIKYSDTYLKTSGDNSNITDFPNDNNNSISFKFKQQMTGQTENNGEKNVEIMLPLKYLSNFDTLNTINQL